MRSIRMRLLGVVMGGALALGSAALLADSEQAKPTTQPYPLTTCVVSGSTLGSMGDPYIHYHEGREVRFCCKGCLSTFNRDPEKYLARIDAAQKKSATTQPATQPSDHSGHGDHSGH